MLWGAWLLVALAPGLVGTLVVGGREVWRRRRHVAADATLALTVAATAGWSVVLLRRTPEFLPWLRWAVAIAGVVVAIALVVPARTWRRGLGRRVLPVVLLDALLAGAGGSTAYALQTAATAHQGSIVSAGPSTGDAMGGGAGGGPGESLTSAELAALPSASTTRWAAATVMAIGGFTGSDPAPSLAQFQATVPPATSTGSSRPRAARAVGPAGARTAWAAESATGSPPTTPRRPSAAPPSTTSPSRRADRRSRGTFGRALRLAIMRDVPLADPGRAGTARPVAGGPDRT